MTYIEREQVDRGDIPAGMKQYVSPVQPAGLGFTIPIIGVDTDDVRDAAGLVTGIFGGGSSTGDPASSVWKNIKPTDSLVLSALNVNARPDGWYVGDVKLSQEDADFRAGTLMAALIGATVPAPRTAWRDAIDNHQLTKEEAWQRWVSRYGSSATLESVLRSTTGSEIGGSPYVAPVPVSLPSQQPAAVPPFIPIPYSQPPQQRPGGLPAVIPPGAPLSPSQVPAATPRAAGFSVSPTMILGGVAIAAALFAFSKRRS